MKYNLISETIDGSIKNIIQLKTLDSSLEYSQMFEALCKTPEVFQNKLVQVLNNCGQNLDCSPLDAFNRVLCGGETDDTLKKLYNWWKGVFEVLSKIKVPDEKQDEFNQKVDDLMAEILKASSVNPVEDETDGQDQQEDEQVATESYETASKEEEDNMQKDMKFAIGKIGEIANKVQVLLNFVNPYCESMGTPDENDLVEYSDLDGVYDADQDDSNELEASYGDFVKIKGHGNTKYQVISIFLDTSDDSWSVVVVDDNGIESGEFKMDDVELIEKGEHCDMFGICPKCHHKTPFNHKDYARTCFNPGCNEILKPSDIKDAEPIMRMTGTCPYCGKGKLEYLNSEEFTHCYSCNSCVDVEDITDSRQSDEDISFNETNNEEIIMKEDDNNEFDIRKEFVLGISTDGEAKSELFDLYDGDDDKVKQTFDEYLHLRNEFDELVIDVTETGYKTSHDIIKFMTENELCKSEDEAIEFITDTLKLPLDKNGSEGEDDEFPSEMGDELWNLECVSGIDSIDYNGKDVWYVSIDPEKLNDGDVESINAICDKYGWKIVDDHSQAEYDSFVRIAPATDSLEEVKESIAGFQIGDRVWWNDPDEGSCSGEYNLVDIIRDYDDEGEEHAICFLQDDDGSEVEVLSDEIEPIEAHAREEDGELDNDIPEEEDESSEWVSMKDLGVANEESENGKNNDEVKSDKKFKGDDGKIKSLDNAGEGNQVCEMTVSQEVTSCDQLLKLLWGSAKENLLDLIESGIATDEEIIGYLEERQDWNLTELNDFLSFDFEILLNDFNVDMRRYADTLDIVKSDTEDIK